jgi:hypothetical protein
MPRRLHTNSECPSTELPTLLLASAARHTNMESVPPSGRAHLGQSARSLRKAWACRSLLPAHRPHCHRLVAAQNICATTAGGKKGTETWMREREREREREGCSISQERRQQQVSALPFRGALHFVGKGRQGSKAQRRMGEGETGCYNANTRCRSIVTCRGESCSAQFTGSEPPRRLMPSISTVAIVREVNLVFYFGTPQKFPKSPCCADGGA